MAPRAMFGKTAEIAGEYSRRERLHRGQAGDAQVDDKEGQERYTTEIKIAELRPAGPNALAPPTLPRRRPYRGEKSGGAAKAGSLEDLEDDILLMSGFSGSRPAPTPMSVLSGGARRLGASAASETFLEVSHGMEQET